MFLFDVCMFCSIVVCVVYVFYFYEILFHFSNIQFVQLFLLFSVFVEGFPCIFVLCKLVSIVI